MDNPHTLKTINDNLYLFHHTSHDFSDNLRRSKIILIRHFNDMWIAFFDISATNDKFMRMWATPVTNSFIWNLIQRATNYGFCNETKVSKSDGRICSSWSFSSDAHQTSMRAMHLWFVTESKRLVGRLLNNLQVRLRNTVGNPRASLKYEKNFLQPIIKHKSHGNLVNYHILIKKIWLTINICRDYCWRWRRHVRLIEHDRRFIKSLHAIWASVIF